MKIVRADYSVLSEALAIKKFDPILCVQKQFNLTLQLPW